MEQALADALRSKRSFPEQCLQHAAGAKGAERLALLSPAKPGSTAQQLSYATMEKSVRALATSLASQLVHQGETVVLAMPDSIELCVSCD